MEDVFYSVPAPYLAANVEVVHQTESGVYYWRLVGAGDVLEARSAESYGNAEIALRDGLNHAISLLP